MIEFNPLSIQMIDFGNGESAELWINHKQPFLLEDEESVALVNYLWTRMRPELSTIKNWSLGDHCWYKPKSTCLRYGMKL